MKMPFRFKMVLYLTLVALYFSGLGIWILEFWFKTDSPLGPQPHRFKMPLLQVHSIVSLWFLIVFGYLYGSHVQEGWRVQKKVKSGLALLLPLIVLISSVPFLFYLTKEDTKASVSQIHTYVGLALILPFFLHYLTKTKKKGKIKTKKQMS